MKILLYVFPSVALNFLFLKKEEEEEKCGWIACFSYSTGLFERKDMTKGIIRTTNWNSHYVKPCLKSLFLSYLVLDN